MIAQEYIDTVLGAACAKLGYPVTNAAFYRETVPAEITDEQLASECQTLIAEQQAAQSPEAVKAATLASVQAQLATLTAQLASLSTTSNP